MTMAERDIVTAVTTAPPHVVNIAEHVAEMARRFPSKPAVVAPGGRGTYAHLTFKQLSEEIDGYAHGLQRVGIGRGTRTILMVRPGLDFFALTFALFKVGAVPVLIDPGMGRKQLIACLAKVEAEAFIGIPLAQVARLIYPKAFASVRVVVTVGRRWFWRGLGLKDIRTVPWRPFDAAPTQAKDPAAILFTSGSTGPAKGVLYEHGMFEAQVRYLQSHFGFGPEEVDLATFPLFALFDAALGMTAVIPDMDPTRPAEVDPKKIIEAIECHGVTHMFGSPALLNRVSRYAEARGIHLDSIKRVLTAGAPVPHAVLERMRGLLGPGAEMHTPYGATEALPVASIESRVILGETKARTNVGAGICVGRPLAGMTVRIAEITDTAVANWLACRTLPAGSIGEICVAGPVVTKAYFRDEPATALAKIHEGDVVWHRMGDVGYLDDSGRLWFCGRKAHRVRTATGTLFTIPCEAVFNQHPLVYRSALVGVGPAGGQRPVVCVELEAEAGQVDRANLTAELLELARANALARSIDTILYHPAFPVDVRHNAKIFREKLAVWAAGQLS